jgi:Lrp/AsnC family transcriptional regulator, leucine-responsive regulatory protein
MPVQSPILLDAFDRAILQILQRDNQTPQRAIGEAVHLSAPAVQRRIQRLRANGVIVGNVALVDPQRVGQSLTLIVAVELESDQPARLQGLRRRIAAATQVQQCYEVTGEVDFMLVVVVASMAEYEALAARLFSADPNVRKFRTYVAVDRFKVGLHVRL